MAGKEPDPQRVQTKEDLAEELTALRSSRGLTVRALARALDSPVATVGDYFSGRHLPGPRQLPLFRSILAACGISAQTEIESWEEALERARRSSDRRAARSPSPYRGLEPFRVTDAELFFGRRAAIADLLSAIDDIWDAGAGTGLIVVVGPSGCGKSSLLMAGVVPAIRSGVLDKPGHECTVIAGGIELLQTERDAFHGEPPSVVIVDQFEEALVAETQTRQALLDRLSVLSGQAVVMVALRADFYHVAAGEPLLLNGLRHHQRLLGPMTAEEVREVVTLPAEHVGAPVEEGLVDLVLDDLTPAQSSAFAHDPGSLPLLSYALLAAWERAGRNKLTIADYVAVGGIRGAVRQAAETLYGGLDDGEQAVARRLFGRLVRVDRDGPPTRRIALRDELLETGDHDADERAASVLEQFVNARLVTVDAETVQISHEALLVAWPRLRDWVESDRDWLTLRHQLSEAATAWERSGHDESLLWRGGRLATASEQAGAADRELNRLESEFLAASIHHRDAALRAERRRTRRTQQLLAGVAVLAAASIVFGAFAVSSRSDAVTARDQALSRQVAIEAQQLAPSDPSLAAQLAVAAYRISPTVQARSVLIDMTASEVPYRMLGAPGPTFLATVRGSDLVAAAYSGADTVILYRTRSGTPIEASEIQAGGPSDQDYAVALGASGQLLAIGGTQKNISLWNTAEPSKPAKLTTLVGASSTVYSLAFSPDHRRLAAADADGALYEWDVTDPQRPTPLARLRLPGSSALKAVAYSNDGHWLAAAGAGVVAIWDPSSGRLVALANAGSATFSQMAFNPDGTLLAATADDGTLHLWNLTPAGSLRPSRPPLTVGTAQLDSIAVSPDGRQLAAGSADGAVHIYDTTTWSQVTTLAHANPVTGAVFGADGMSLTTADSTGTIRVWRLPTPTSITAPGNVFFLSYLGQSHDLIAASGGSAGTARLIDTTNPLHPSAVADVNLPPGLGHVEAVAAPTPDGRYLAAGNRDAKVELLDIRDPLHPTPVAGPLKCAKPLIEQLTAAPDGRFLVSVDDSGQVCVWDIAKIGSPRLASARSDTSGEILGFSISTDSRMLATAASDNKVRLYDIGASGVLTMRATLGGFTNYALTTAFSPDGRTLIAGSADGTIRLWNITHPSKPKLIGHPLSGPTAYVYQISLTPDGKTMAAATTNHAVWIWDISHPSSPDHVATLQAAQDAVFAVRFSPGGDVLAASGSDDTIHLWEYQPAAAERAVCGEVGQAITRQEWARYLQGAPYRVPCS